MREVGERDEGGECIGCFFLDFAPVASAGGEGRFEGRGTLGAGWGGLSGRAGEGGEFGGGRGEEFYCFITEGGEKEGWV